MHTDGAVYTLSAIEGAIYDQIEVNEDNYLEEYSLGLYYFNDYVPQYGVKSIKFRYYRPNKNLLKQQNISIAYITKGLKNFKELWQLTSTPDTPDKPTSSTSIGGWSTDNSLRPTAQYPYLWNVEIVMYSDGSEEIMQPENIATWRQGRGLLSITDYYKTTESGDIPSRPLSPTVLDGWTTDNSLRATQEKPYLWNCEIVVYDDGTMYFTDPITIGVWMKGDPGKSIEEVREYWQLTATSEAPAKPKSPTSRGAWSTDNSLRPSQENPYLWNVEIIIYDDQSFDILTPENIATWIKGRGVESITDYYQLSNTATPPAKPTSASSMGNWSTDNTIKPNVYQPYLWNLEVIRYDDGTSNITNPACISQWVQGSPGTDGKDGENAVSIVLDKPVLDFTLRQNGKTNEQCFVVNVSAYIGENPSEVYNISVVTYTTSGLSVTASGRNKVIVTSSFNSEKPNGNITIKVRVSSGEYNVVIPVTSSIVNEYLGGITRWTTGVTYKVDDRVYEPTDGNVYRCLIAHYSYGQYRPASSSAYWEKISVLGSYFSWVDKTSNIYKVGATYDLCQTSATETTSIMEWKEFDSLMANLTTFDDIIGAIEDATEDDTSIPTVQLVKKLAAATVMTRNLICQFMILKDNGYIKTENYEQNKGFYIDTEGNITSGAYNQTKGVSGYKLDKDGNLIANNGTFGGELKGATGTFSGKLSAATGTFSGVVAAKGLQISGLVAGDIKFYSISHKWPFYSLKKTVIIYIYGEGYVRLKINTHFPLSTGSYATTITVLDANGTQKLYREHSAKGEGDFTDTFDIPVSAGTSINFETTANYDYYYSDMDMTQRYTLSTDSPNVILGRLCSSITK